MKQAKLNLRENLGLLVAPQEQAMPTSRDIVSRQVYQQYLIRVNLSTITMI